MINLLQPVEMATNDTEPFISVDLLNQFKQDMINQGYGSFYSFDTFENGNFIDSNTKTLFVGWQVINAERARLQAEVDRLKSTVSYKQVGFVHLKRWQAGNAPEHCFSTEKEQYGDVAVYVEEQTND